MLCTGPPADYLLVDFSGGLVIHAPALAGLFQVAHGDTDEQTAESMGNTRKFMGNASVSASVSAGRDMHCGDRFFEFPFDSRGPFF